MISGATVTRTWASACDFLVAQAKFPSFLVISAEANIQNSEILQSGLDNASRQKNLERPTTVADVLLPSRTLKGMGNLDERLLAGWQLFGRGRRRGLKFSGWRNTYFERITGGWMDRNLHFSEIKENRLKSIVQKINSWGVDHEAAFYIHTDHPNDHLRTRGAPCLQYVQFRLYEGNKLELFALYRAHDYAQKALGNMLGLERLGHFVGSETQRTFERLTIFSLHPIIGCSKVELKSYVDNVRQLPGF